MSKNSTRRLGAVFVALLVACSFAGGPVIAAAAATGTVGDDVSGTLDSSDGSTDSTSSDGDDSSDDGSSDDGSTDNETTDDGSADDSSGDDTSDGDDSTDDSSTDEEDSTENVSSTVGETVNGTTSTVEDTGEAVEDTAEATTTDGLRLVGSTTDTDLNSALGLPIDGLKQTERATAGDAAPDEHRSPRMDGAAAGSNDGAGEFGADVADIDVAHAIGTTASTALSTDGDGGQPIPGGLAGGTTLGLSALAAAAVVRSTPLVSGSTSSSTSSAVSGYLSGLLDKVKPFVFPLRYSRYDDSDPLEHEARELVYEIVNETPGSYLSEVSEQAGLPLSTTRHHMKVLEREELVSGAKLRGKRRFYPAYAEGIELAAALNDDSTASIIDALARLGAASVSDLADDLGRDPSTISHHLQRLEEDEIITRERQGRAVVNKLSAEARTALEPETTPRPGEAAEALAD